MLQGSRRYAIVNRDRVARVVRLGLRPYGGNQSKAALRVAESQVLSTDRKDHPWVAKAARAFQRTLSRLQRKELAAITQRTLDYLRSLLHSRPALYDELRLSLVSRERWDALGRQSRWTNKWLERVPSVGIKRDEWERYGERAPVPGGGTSLMTKARAALPLPAPEEGARLVDAVRRAFPDVCRPFETSCRRRGHSESRIQVAYARSAEPLLASYETARVEREWRELNDAELKRYWELSLKRELLLLNRGPDLDRVAARQNLVGTSKRRGEVYSGASSGRKQR